MGTVSILKPLASGEAYLTALAYSLPVGQKPRCIVPTSSAYRRDFFGSPHEVPMPVASRLTGLLALSPFQGDALFSRPRAQWAQRRRDLFGSDFGRHRDLFGSDFGRHRQPFAPHLPLRGRCGTVANPTTALWLDLRN